MARSSRTAPKARVGKAAHSLLRERLGLVQKRLRAAAHKGSADSEAIHQVRVATRRARAAIELFAPLLKARHVEWFGKQLRKIRKAADQARNLDVCVARWQTAGVEISPAVTKLCERARRKAQGPLAELDQRLRKEGRWSRKLVKLLGRLNDPQRRTELWSQPLSTFAASALAPSMRAFLAAVDAPHTSAPALHRVRVAGKQLRYGLELLEAGLPKRASETLLAQLTRLQDELGAINDHATAGELIDELARSAKPDATRNWLHTQLRSERVAFSQARTKFLEGWAAKRKRQFRKWCKGVIPGIGSKGKSRRPRTPK